MTTVCPSCQSALPADAKFCPSCGTTVGAHTCSCGVPLGPQARFCHKCGRAAGATAAVASPAVALVPLTGTSKTPWIVASLVIAALLGTVIWRAYVNESKKPDAPVMANAGNAPPSGIGDPAGGGPAAPFAGNSGGNLPTQRAPDISNLTPQQRFARLFNRVMMAGEKGDTATVGTFTPMALASYDQLPARAQGDRFDVALLHLQIGNVTAARALADTIRLNGRTNLLGDALVATIARAEGSAPTELAALRTFKANFAAEQAKQLPEYELRSGLLALVKARADSIVR
jgi:hypothetical protein